MAIGSCWLLFPVARNNILTFVILEEQKKLVAEITEGNGFTRFEI